MADEIYDRQSRIMGWNQEKLSQSRVAVLGSDILAQQILVNLVGLGITNLHVMSNQRIGRGIQEGFLFGHPKFYHWGKRRLDYITSELLQINPSLQSGLQTFFSPFDEWALARFNPDILITSTPNQSIIEQSLDFSIHKMIPMIAGFADTESASMATYRPQDSGSIDQVIASNNKGDFQGHLPSGVLAAVMADEVRKSLMPLNTKDCPLAPGKKFEYSLWSNHLGGTSSAPQFIDMSTKRALVVGAGAIANSLVPHLAMQKYAEITIVDGDVIEFSNLSRQFEFRGHIGEKKSAVLSKRVKQISPTTRAFYAEKNLDEKQESRFYDSGKRKYDFIFGAVDNLQAREITNNYARIFKIPYIDGATSSLDGELKIYGPSLTRCIDCQIDFESVKPKKMEGAGRTGCAQAAPSVIIPNFVIGSLMAAEAVRVAYGYRYFTEVPKKLVYDSMSPLRVLTTDTLYKKNCGCEI